MFKSYKKSITSHIYSALKSPDKRIKTTAIAVLIHFKTEAIDELVQLLKDADPEIRMSAAYSLIQLDAQIDKSILIIAEILQDKELENRRRAAFILSEIGEKAYLVKDLLEKAANDPDPEVKEDVLETLSKIKLHHQA